MIVKNRVKLAILTQQGEADNNSVRLLAKQMRDRGMPVDVIQFQNSKMGDHPDPYTVLEVRGQNFLVKDGKPLDVRQYDGVMLRSWEVGNEGYPALKIFADAGVPMANDYERVLAADSKASTFERFTKANIPVPKTEVLAAGGDIDHALNQIEGFPIVIKRDIDARGLGVSFANSREEARNKITELFKSGDTKVVVQQFIRTGDRQKTHRCLVINGRPIGTIELTAKEGSLLTNAAQGGRGKRIEQPPQGVLDLAVRAANVMGMNITGVDIITDEAGKHYVLEANDSPMISAFPIKYKIPADALAAEAFIEKMQKIKMENSRTTAQAR